MRYIISEINRTPGQAATTLPRVLDYLKADPQVKIIRTGGLNQNIDRIIADMPPQKADALRREFGAGLLVESDAPLSEGPPGPFTI